MVEQILSEYPYIGQAAVFVGLVIATVLGWRGGKAKTGVVTGAVAFDSKLGDAILMVLQDIAKHLETLATSADRIEREYRQQMEELRRDLREAKRAAQ